MSETRDATLEHIIQEELERNLQWVKQKRHIRESREAQDNPELYENVCKIAAAVITLINMQERGHAFPAGKWKAHRGIRSDGKERAALTVDVSSLRKMIGRNDIPRANQIQPKNARAVYNYVCVIWERMNPGEDDFTGDRINFDKLITAFPSQLDDQVATTTAQGEFVWEEFGKRDEKASLAASLLKRFQK